MYIINLVQKLIFYIYSFFYILVLLFIIIIKNTFLIYSFIYFFYFLISIYNTHIFKNNENLNFVL